MWKNMASWNNREVAIFSKGRGKYKPKNQNLNKQNKNSGNNSKSKEMNAASRDCT